MHAVQVTMVSLSVACSENILCTGALYRFTGLFGLSFSRYLDNNQLTALPGDLLTATTQLKCL